MPETILVTGSAGFIGFHVANALMARGDTVIGYDNVNDYYDVKLKEARLAILEKNDRFTFYRADLADLDAMKNVFESHPIDRVCHLAAQAGVRYSLENPFVYEQANCVGFLNIIELSKDHKVKNFVYASSSSVYGGNKKKPFCVEDRVDNPVSLYAATKKSNELTAHVYHHLYDLPCTGLRFFTVYGPWGRPDMALFKFTKAILAGKPIDVYNHGKMKRDFTYIDDIVAGVLASIDRASDYEIFNLGNSNTVELLYFIECIEKALGKKADKNMMPMQPGDVPETYADIDRSREILGFDPKTNIEEGITKFIAWYKQWLGTG
jgi:UDP-glucuronate 4-epimerase